MANVELVLEVLASSVIAAYTYWLANPGEVNASKISSLIAGVLTAIDGL